MNFIQGAYESVRKFNSIAGNLAGVDVKSVAAQLDFIEEELKESSDAANHGDATELLDGACDLFVTVAGLMQKLEAAGFDVEEALKRVCENNLSKFPTVAQCRADEYFLLPDVDVPVSGYDVDGRCVFKRDSDGKIMKPRNFKPVILTGLAPEGFF